MENVVDLNGRPFVPANEERQAQEDLVEALQCLLDHARTGQLQFAAIAAVYYDSTYSLWRGQVPQCERIAAIARLQHDFMTADDEVSINNAPGSWFNPDGAA